MMSVISPLAHQKYLIWGKTNDKPLLTKNSTLVPLNYAHFLSNAVCTASVVHTENWPSGIMNLCFHYPKPT